MSILIKGAKMPKYCIACPCLDKDLQICEVLKKDMDIFEDKLPDCPLVEIPSHGRLIDADALTKRATTVGETDDLWDYYSQSTQDFVDYVNEAPTVIESE